jgi:murein L,D-transpeptidase YcbB/YkuD
MRKSVLSIVIILFGLSAAMMYHNSNENLAAKLVTFVQTFQNHESSTLALDSNTVAHFFKKYPDLRKYHKDVTILYKKRNYQPIWFDDKGLIEFAYLLYAKANSLQDEGLAFSLPYKDKIDEIFNSKSINNLSHMDTEIMLSTLYLFYAQKVYHGIDSKKIQEMGWFIPRKSLSYKTVLDSLLADPKLLNKNENQLFGQYYKLREVLKKHRQIQKKGDWTPIEANPFTREFYRPNDSSKTIGQIRHRLFITGDLKRNSKSNRYDSEMMAGVLNFKKRNGYKPNYTITYSHILRMNTPIEDYIKIIIVNMERCRWIAPELTKAEEYIVVNIPSFKLIYKRNGKKELESNVFVGKSMTETVVFSGNMTQIIFSPYWNVPTSILENELKLQIAKDTNYIAAHDMEWYKGNLRQRPGIKNPMGLVKFNFPNSNNIFLHDTPSKSLFDLEYRAFSHGCINVSKAKELALLILKDDPHWPPERINDAMRGIEETTCILKKKIPIHVGYFTAWVNDTGEINFYTDVYQRDERLFQLLVLSATK